MTCTIKGFNPHTFIDWEGKVSCVIYLPGCNFRCPFCHSSGLVLEPEALPSVEYRYIENFLKEKKGWIDAVVVGGGEPTLHSNLPQLLKDIKNRGLLVKLDTNGTNPEMIKKLIAEGLVDYIAMDVKAPLIKEKYDQVTCADVDLISIKESIDLLKDGETDYEFRTTVVPVFHKQSDILTIARTIGGARRYILQQFAPKDTLDENMASVKPYREEELKKFAQLAGEFVINCFVRGV